jgi:hypothetical protein
MAWYVRSLEKMKKAAKKENWDEVYEILKEHNRYYVHDKNKPKDSCENDISNTEIRIQTYGNALD